MGELLSRRNIEFLLYEVLDSESLLARPRYLEHSRETFDSVLDLVRTVAENDFAPHYQKGDANEPTFDGSRVHMIPETRNAWNALRNTGFLKAHCDLEEGGLQLPEVVLRASMAYLMAANGPTASYPFLTLGVINLLRVFGSEKQKQLYLPRLLEGEFAGTMALTEPGQGSALADIKTRAETQADGTFRIFGQKMFISAGDHDLTENIVHMVLAKVKGAPAGVKGISLFLVPKFLVNDDGSLGARNDVVLAGLLHKMGWRNTTSTVLNFGEAGGAVGYLVGGPGQGLACMFRMMNEARIGVGLFSAAYAARGFQHALDYARQRPQGRLPSCKLANSPQVKLVEHADVRRMLLAQKAYAEGALALCLYASALFEDEQTLPDAAARQHARILLSLLTPVVKSWPARYGCVANELAIQVFGGAGYIRDYPVEQLYRDQRLNPIHEGAEGIHGLDLLSRKVRLERGAGLEYLAAEVCASVAAAGTLPELAGLATQLAEHFELLADTTADLLAAAESEIDLALANASVYLDVFGRVVVSWLWLKQATVAAERMRHDDLADSNGSFYRGKLQAARWYFTWELPQIVPACRLLRTLDPLPYDMQDAWF